LNGGTFNAPNEMLSFNRFRFPGLVNAAQVDSGPVTTYTYDPSGNPTVSGTANDWPFQYQGMEKEFTDPAPYYYSGSGSREKICRTNELSDV
jgi:hypothetical protein